MPIHYCDRSRITTDWRCPRSRYWQYEHLGRGLSPTKISLPLGMGIQVHDALAAIATFHKEGQAVDIDAIANLAFRQMFESLTEKIETPTSEDVDYAKEQATLVEGLIRGYHKHVWPRLLNMYPEIVAIEQEVEYKLDDDIVFMAKPDLLMADREGETHYIEFKSTSSKKVEWINSWETAVQLHSSVKATEQTLGQAPVDVTIIGLYKGYNSYNKQSSVLCYGYGRKGSPPFVENLLQYEYKAGFRRTPTWEMAGGVKAWIDGMPENILADQFPMSPPIIVNDDLVEAFFRQQRVREHNVILYHKTVEQFPEMQQELLDVHFPQKWDSCSPAYGFGCDFKRLCHSRVENPLEEGFVQREPHHQSEREQMGLEDAQ